MIYIILKTPDRELHGGWHGKTREAFCFNKSQSHVLTMWQIKNQKETHTQRSGCGCVTEPNHNWEDPLKGNLKVFWQTANALGSNVCRLWWRGGIHAVFYLPLQDCADKMSAISDPCLSLSSSPETHTHTRARTHTRTYSHIHRGKIWSQLFSHATTPSPPHSPLLG